MTSCKDCGRKFHSKWWKDYCRHCRKIRLIYPPDRRRRRLKMIFETAGRKLDSYRTDIKILWMKKDQGVLESIDIFIIASIHLDVFDNPHAFSRYEPMEQARFMIEELNNIMNEKDKWNEENKNSQTGESGQIK